MDRSLGRALGDKLRDAGWKVEIHDQHFAENTPDDEWLVTVGERGWVVLTKDKAIRRKAIEKEAVINAKVRIFTLPNGSMTGQEMADAYLNSRAKIGRFLKDNAAPFIAVVYQDAKANIRKCDLSTASPGQDDA